MGKEETPAQVWALYIKAILSLAANHPRAKRIPVSVTTAKESGILSA
jgi:hypothetical protein